MNRISNINRRDFLKITGGFCGSCFVLSPFSGCSGNDTQGLVPQKIYNSAYLTKLSEDVKAMLRSDLTNVNKTILDALVLEIDKTTETVTLAQNFLVQ